MFKKILPICVFALAFTACTSSEEKVEKPEKKTTAESEVITIDEDCTYRIDTEKVQANWTAFKLADKVGVNGSFMSFAIDSITAEQPEMILEGLKASVQTSSVNTQDEARDKKIVNSFFLTMAESSMITAEFSGVQVTEEKDGTVKGNVNVSFKMNGIVHSTPATFNYSKNVMKVLGTVNIPDFSADHSLSELNKVCEEKHKGDGDKAITWPDVNFSLSAPLIKNCK